MWIAIACVAIFILKNPKLTADSVYASILFCVKIIVPSLFPFLILSNILIESGFAEFFGYILRKPVKLLFNVNGNCAVAILLGSIAGFPVGAKCAAILYEKGLCNKSEAARILPYCNNAGPAFIIGAIGVGIFNDYKVGVLIYISQLLSALICGILLSFPRRTIETPSAVIIKNNSDSSAISKSIINAGMSMISICGHICFFSFILDIIIKFITHITTNPYIITLICGLFEITSGVKCAGSIPFGIAIAGLFCGWSGLSVHMQISSFVKPQGISMKYCLWGKLLQGVLTFIIILFLK